MIYNINLRNAIITNGIDQLKQYKPGSKVLPGDYYDKDRPETYLNTPVVMPLLIREVNYTDDSGIKGNLDGMFLDTVLMTVSQTKVIEETKITGRNGTIKEYIAEGDFEVALKVILASPSPNAFPSEAAGRLIKLMRVPVPLQVVSPFLNLYDIDEIVVKTVSAPQRQGFQNMFTMDITASSHSPLELRLIYENNEKSNMSGTSWSA